MHYGKKTRLDDAFVRQNLMGPSALRIIEELTDSIILPPKAKILDLGCGTGLTSIFLAMEYDAVVFATDLWIDATENLERFRTVGLEDQIIPIHAEAHDLPYAQQYFDAIVSVDSYQYFGADPTYLDKHIAPLLKDGGTLAVSMPGLREGLTQKMLPSELTKFWNGENIDFYALQWWKDLWAQSNQVTKEKAFSHQCHRVAWEEWLVCDNPYAQQDINMMKVEDGKYFDTIALVYQKTSNL